MFEQIVWMRSEWLVLAIMTLGRSKPGGTLTSQMEGVKCFGTTPTV